MLLICVQSHSITPLSRLYRQMCVSVRVSIWTHLLQLEEIVILFFSSTELKNSKRIVMSETGKTKCAPTLFKQFFAFIFPNLHKTFPRSQYYMSLNSETHSIHFTHIGSLNFFTKSV